MRTEPRRLVSAVVAIVLGVAFLGLALLVGDSINATLARDARASVGPATVVVTPTKDVRVVAAAPEAIRGVAGVTAVRPEVATILAHDLPGRTGVFTARSLPRLDADTRVVAGRVPAAPGEVAVDELAASTRSLAVGQDVRLLGDAGEPITVRLVGVLHVRAATQAGGLPQLFASDADLMRWSGSPGYTALYVTATGTPAQVADAVRAAVPGATVRTGEAEVAVRVKETTRGSDQVTLLFGAFGVVALFVTALVIANTFSIVVAQRARELALLRCVGATRGQVFRAVLGEAAVVGVVGSVLGMGVALAAMATLVATGTTLALPLTTLGITPVAVAVPVAAGVALTLLASLAPARRATAVAPLAALRPQPVEAGRRAGRVRVAAGLLAVVAGGALLAAGATLHQVGPGIAGGVVSFVGVLALAPAVVPRLAGVLGAAARSTTGRLAVENSRRNPARAASTAAALLVGVTLITMMGVGAQTGSATISAELDRQFPADVSVTAPAGLTPALRARLATASEVAAWTEAVSLGVTTGGKDLELVGLGPNAADVLRTGTAAAGLRDGVLLLPSGTLAAEGQQLTLAYGERTLTVRAHLVPGIGVATLTLADARTLAPDVPGAALVRFPADRDAATTTEALATALAEVAPGVQVMGGAAQRQEMLALVDTVLLVAVGLLAVAVVIALVGVGNTLGLSVLERTQETGLLRALGLTREQVRAMVGVEALTLSGVAVALGLLLGTAYGVAGIGSILGGQVSLVVSIPWGRLGVAALVALGAGWLASVVPAARASRVSPAAALTYE